jgi:hypothetical protein
VNRNPRSITLLVAKQKIFNSFSATTLLFQGTVVSFQPLTTPQNLGSSLSGFFNNVNCSGSSCLAGFLNGAFKMALAAGAILAVLRLAYAGWLYMGAADMWGSKQHAKEVITDSVVGLLLLIGIWIILNQINPCILNLNVLADFSGAAAQQCSGTSSGGSTVTTVVAGQQAQLIQAGGTP